MFYYFGYGSNLSETSLRAKGVTPVTCVPAILHDWRLTFNIPNFFRIEGGTGNIEPAAGESVHGVLYGCRDADLAALDEIEALNVTYRRVQLTVETYGGRTIPAYVYVALPERLAEGLQPSRRYLNILIRGAEDMRLDPSYIERLTRMEVCHRPSYGPFTLPDDPDDVFTPETLPTRALHTALAGAVFDMSGARVEHQYLQQLMCGRDVTLFFLKRMDTSDGNESWQDLVAGQLSALQREYLNDYLHEFAREYRYAGKMDYAAVLHAPAAPSLRPPRNPAAREVASRRVLRTAEQTNQLLGHENLGFLSESHGFMPIEPPKQSLPRPYGAWDEAVGCLTDLYRTLKLRRALDAMPVLPGSAEHLPDAYVLRAAACLSMLSHAYWYVETTPPSELPESLARPWREVLRRLGRDQEVLSYIDLIVYNWRLVDAQRADPMRAENMRLLVPTVDNREERIFYLTQSEILAQASPIIGAVVRAQEAVAHDDRRGLADEIMVIVESLQRIVRESLLNINPNPASPTYVDPVIWAKTVAPFAVPFQRNLQGPSGTSSPIFNLLDIFFGRRKHETFLGREIRALRQGYPLFWREFLSAVSETSVPEYVAASRDPSLSGLLKDAVEVYAGENGFLGRHRMKVYGYLELGFKVGRNVTIGGFSGVFKDRTWDRVDSELEYSRMERLDTFPKGCHYAKVKQVGQTHPGASEGVKHVVLDVSGTGVRYQAGDRCGILPENGDELVERTIQALHATGAEVIELTSEWQDSVRLRAGYDSVTSLTLRDVLRFGRIRPVTPRVAEALHAATQNEALLDAIVRQTTTRWELWDLLQTLEKSGYDPSRLWQAGFDSSENICRVVPPENFRVYSIASVMGAKKRDSATEVHLTVGRVRYHETTAALPDVQRRGTASNFLAEMAGRNRPVSFMIQHPARFSLPKDPSLPVVMFAGGTGMSPFRSFVLERMRQRDAGHCYLFLALRSREHFYYRDEVLHWLASGKLDLDVAFSREDIQVRYEPSSKGGEFAFDPGPRRHIEDVLLDQHTAAKLRKLLASKSEGGEGAYVYICGRSPFARNVNEAFKKLFAGFYSGPEEERNKAAVRALAQMVGEGRYMQEIFTDARTWDVERKQFDVSEVVQHNAEEHGYWLVIDNLVYDMTEFINMHPGGMRVLLGYAGMDATQGYVRAHNSRSEIDAMREMYEIGAVRHLDFKRVSRVVQSPSGPQTVALAALHRVWVSFAYLVVEMQNALRNDQSLQNAPIMNGDVAAPRNLYKLERGVETHERFLRSYLDGLAAEPSTHLWELTHGLCNPAGDAHWMERELRMIQGSDPAAYVAALTTKLKKSVAELVAAEAAPEDPEYVRIAEALALLEAADREFLRKLKALVAEGLAIFEQFESRTLDVAGEVLLSTLSDLPRLLQRYYEDLRSQCEAGGWMPTIIPKQQFEYANVRRPTMKTLVSSSYWLMEEDDFKRIVILRRSPVAVQSIEDLVSQNERVISNMREIHKTYGIVVDMRQAPSRNDPEFENAMRNLRRNISMRYARLAVLVSSAVGVLQVNRIGRNEGAEQLATQDEYAAIKFAMGQ